MFNLILTVLTVVTGLVWLLDRLLLARRRREQAIEHAAAEGAAEPKPGPVVEFCVSLFPVIFAVFVVRSFIVEPFRIPSGSMIPTLHVGDFILVNKYGYGLRCPVGSCKLVDIGEPRRGDVVVFKYPRTEPGDPNIGADFIKRVIGVPGDHIRYVAHELYVNDERVPVVDASTPSEDPLKIRKLETLNGVRHDILISEGPSIRDVDLVVPPGQYFMMGDNRDGSNDSRFWGFVPEANLKGRAIVIWLSWDGGPVLSRFGTIIH